jgi:predicted DNA-binding transcriptional regulator AlpA
MVASKHLPTNTPPSEQLSPHLINPNAANIGFYRVTQILQLIPIGKSTWWAWVNSGRAPAGLKLSQSVTAWRKDDIHLFIEKLANECPATNAVEAENV